MIFQIWKRFGTVLERFVTIWNDLERFQRFGTIWNGFGTVLERFGTIWNDMLNLKRLGTVKIELIRKFVSNIKVLVIFLLIIT